MMSTIRYWRMTQPSQHQQQRARCLLVCSAITLGALGAPIAPHRPCHKMVLLSLATLLRNRNTPRLRVSNHASGNRIRQKVQKLKSDLLQFFSGTIG